jgi:hypothetical protein
MPHLTRTGAPVVVPSPAVSPDSEPARRPPRFVVRVLLTSFTTFVLVLGAVVALLVYHARQAFELRVRDELEAGHRLVASAQAERQAAQRHRAGDGAHPERGAGDRGGGVPVRADDRPRRRAADGARVGAAQHRGAARRRRRRRHRRSRPRPVGDRPVRRGLGPAAARSRHPRAAPLRGLRASAARASATSSSAPRSTSAISSGWPISPTRA